MSKDWLAEFIESVKVGTVVCDCRCKHLKVVDYDESWCLSKWMEAICYPILPRPIYHRLEALLWGVPVLARLYDKRVTLEDGRICSLIDCCGPVDHPIEDHQ